MLNIIFILQDNVVFKVAIQLHPRKMIGRNLEKILLGYKPITKEIFRDDGTNIYSHQQRCFLSIYVIKM
jgi:hypothetical protein